MCTHLSITHLVSFKTFTVICLLILACIKRCIHYICKQRHLSLFIQQFYWQLSISLSPFSSCSIQKGNELATFQPWNSQSTNRSFVSFSVSVVVAHINKALESQQNLTRPFQSKEPCKQWQRTMWPLLTHPAVFSLSHFSRYGLKSFIFQGFMVTAPGLFQLSPLGVKKHTFL